MTRMANWLHRFTTKILDSVWEAAAVQQPAAPQADPFINASALEAEDDGGDLPF